MKSPSQLNLNYQAPHPQQGYQPGPQKLGPPQQPSTKPPPPAGPVPEQQRLSHEQVTGSV